MSYGREVRRGIDRAMMLRSSKSVYVDTGACLCRVSFTNSIVWTRDMMENSNNRLKGCNTFVCTFSWSKISVKDGIIKISEGGYKVKLGVLSHFSGHFFLKNTSIC